MPRLGALSERLQSCENRMQQQPFLQQGGEDAEVCSETLQVTMQCSLSRGCYGLQTF